jgi:hypothetical protein
MKQALATKTINKANRFTGPESDGFKRYMALPRNVSLNMKIAHHLAGKPDNTFTQTVADFFGGMSESEYRTWLLVNL